MKNSKAMCKRFASRVYYAVKTKNYNALSNMAIQAYDWGRIAECHAARRGMMRLEGLCQTEITAIIKANPTC